VHNFFRLKKLNRSKFLFPQQIRSKSNLVVTAKLNIISTNMTQVKANMKLYNVLMCMCMINVYGMENEMANVIIQDEMLCV
jgi:hypothetical protein